MQFKEKPIVIERCFAFGAEHKALILLVAKPLAGRSNQIAMI